MWKLPRRLLPVVVLTGVPLAVGCIMPDQIAQVQKDVADVQQRLGRAERTQTELAQQVEALLGRQAEGDDAVTREEIADLQLRVEQSSREMGVNGQRINDLEQRLEHHSQELQRARDGGRRVTTDSTYSPPPSPETIVDPGSRPGSSAVPDPEALYNTAYADFSKGNYALAIAGFEEYQERFAQSALADNALYWVAECRFSEGDYRSAIEALDDLLGRYPDSDKTAAANLKKALAFQEQNQIQQAIIQYRYVVAQFPGSDEARLARDKLSGLGSSPH